MSPPPDHSPAGSLFCGEDAGEVIYDHPSPPSPASFSPATDEAAIGELIDAENHHIPERDYLQRCRDRFVDITARLDAINWILKVTSNNNNNTRWNWIGCMNKYEITNRSPFCSIDGSIENKCRCTHSISFGQ